MHLLTLVNDEDVGLKEVAAFLTQDASLSAEILTIANSAAFARRGEVRSILHAIAILGLSRLTTIILTALTGRIFSGFSSAPAVRLMWRHSVACALISEHLGSGHHGIDQAYTSGLLHSIGQPALFQRDRQKYAAVVATSEAGKGTTIECERSEFNSDHCEVSRSLLRGWGFPDEIVKAAAAHHDPGPRTYDLAGVTRAGCEMAERAGFIGCRSFQPRLEPENAIMEDWGGLMATLKLKVDSMELALCGANGAHERQ